MEKIESKEVKPIHAKPSLYAYYYENLKQIAKDAGWNLLLHGSMNRDLDLLLIPWAENITKTHMDLIQEFMHVLGGSLNDGGQTTHHGRLQYVINLNRGGYYGELSRRMFLADQQYYIDISVIPLI